MKNILKTIVFAATMTAMAAVSSASFFDGKTPLLCTVHQLFECDPPNACQPVTPGQINGVSHLDIDFSKKLITKAGEQSAQESKIDSIEAGVDGKLVIQGIEDGAADIRDGAGWTITIMDPEGTMTMAVAGDGFAVVGLGACVPKP